MEIDLYMMIILGFFSSIGIMSVFFKLIDLIEFTIKKLSKLKEEKGVDE